MYTPEEYKRAKAALDDPELDRKSSAARIGEVAEKVAEYEAAQSAPAAGPGLSPEDETRLKMPLAIGGPLANESIAPDYQWHPRADFDATLPNATKRKKYSTPPEYVTKRPGAALVGIATASMQDPLNGRNRYMYFEPSEKQFQADMGEYLKAKGVAAGSEGYRLAYDDYKDRKWQQAYEKAAAADTPLLRVAFVPESANGWTKLSAYLADKTDAAAAFAKGFASAGTGGATRALNSDADRENLARHPIAETLGELGGTAAPGGLVSRLTGGIGRLRGVAALGPVGSAAVSGAIAAPVDVASHAGADELSNRIYGRPVDEDAKGRFTSKLLGSALIGGGMGAVGEYLAGGANAYRKHIRTPPGKAPTELTNAEASGTATDFVSGLEPSSGVAKYLEQARGGMPGEGKALPMGDAVEYAASNVRGPLVAQHVAEREGALAEMGSDNARFYESPTGKQSKPISAIGKVLLDALRARSRAGDAGALVPGSDAAMPFAKNGWLQEAFQRSFKPRLVADVDAAAEAQRVGGHVLTLEEAQKSGFPIKGLEHEANPATGLPHDAPSLSGYSSVRDSEILPGGAEPRDSMPSRPVPDAQPPDLALGATRPDMGDATMVDIPPGARPETKTLASEPDAAMQVPASAPPQAFKVVIEPHKFNAQQMDEQIGLIDRAGKAGSETRGDPVFDDLIKAARIDREQFGKSWAGLKDIHYKRLNELEQQGGHAGITENKPFEEMSPNAQKAATGAVTQYGVGPQDASEKLAGLADRAGVRPELETLRGTRAYSALKEKAAPSISEGVGGGGAYTRLGGLLPGAKLRADAFARNLARGPEGEALYATKFNPQLLNEPLGREVKPSGPFANILSMGRGALGIKTGSVYDSYSGRAGPGSTLSPEEKATLQRLLEQQ